MCECKVACLTFWVRGWAENKIAIFQSLLISDHGTRLNPNKTAYFIYLWKQHILEIFEKN